MAIARPFQSAVNATTRDHLVPAVDGAQSLYVFDGQGLLSHIPGGASLPQPLAIPRFGAAIELNDAEQFKVAMTNYAEASRKLIADVRTTYPQLLPPGIALPSPETTDTPDGTLYYYKLPIDLGHDVYPCGLFKGRLLVVASSSRLAAEMARQQPMPDCSITELDQAAGSVMIVEFGELWDYTRDFSNGCFRLGLKHNPTDQQTISMIKMHVDAVVRSLSAICSYRSTLTLQNGQAVRHSWFHVEDIDR